MRVGQQGIHATPPTADTFALVLAAYALVEFDFVAALVDSQVFILLNSEVSDSGDKTDVQPLQLADQQGNNVLAVFTSPERSSPMAARFPNFNYGLLVAFRWLLQAGGSDV